MGKVIHCNFRLRRALTDRQASIKAYGEALRANAPAKVLTELQRWCLATDEQLHALGM